MGEFSFTERDGHVLTVTLNRPERMNALHSPAHFELDQVFNDFEADPDLWVCILTGAGDRAFSAGNDLKFQAEGGTRDKPKSGFGGITERFNRTKPMIAAVNVRTDEEAKAIVDLAIENLKVYFDCICDYRQTADKEKTIEAQNYYCHNQQQNPHTPRVMKSLGLKEEDAYPADPEDGYGWEKLFSERMCRHFMEDYGIEVRIARYHNIYGPYGTYDGGREKAPAAVSYTHLTLPTKA